MPTIHETANIKSCNEALQDPEWASLLGQILARMSTGFYDQKLVDVILQKHRTGYDIYDAYSFSQVYAGIIHGEIATAEIEIGKMPYADKLIKENNDALTNLDHCTILTDSENGKTKEVGSVFRAEFWGGLKDSDGYLEWLLPIELCRQSENVVEKVVASPRRLELEVGYTQGNRTVFHLALERGLARWPYNSSVITILVVIDKALWNPYDGNAIITDL